MPELPEVESIKLQLQKYLIGHKIEKLEIRNPKYALSEKEIVGAQVKDIRRFAKVLAIDLSNSNSLVIHIKLTGQLIYRGPNLKNPGPLSKKIAGGVPGPHTHVTFVLDKGGVLHYNDIRRFGWLRVMPTNEVEKTGFVAKLGPEPFGKLDLAYFKGILAKTKRAIKVVLMDQAKIGGVGNIYANDALWLAKIDPKRPANSLTDAEVEVLYDAVHQVLRAGLKYGGASELAFVTPDGSEGKYQDHTLAYGHDGQSCGRCKSTKFVKYFLAGRGTYACQNCQK